jgi:NADP-dependent 3-hydroxy acid dehydrogenase YdfG
MPRRPEDIVPLITGASGGIGADTARALAAEGATLALVAACTTA